MECFSLTNPNPTLGLLPFNNELSSSSMPSFSSFPATSPFCFRSELLHRRRSSLPLPLPPAKCLAGFSLSRSRNVSLSHSPLPRKTPNPRKQKLRWISKGWKQALASFKERVLKLQSAFQEVYEECSEKRNVILKEAAAELEIQTDQARQDLSILTKELHEEGRQCLILAAEISPKPVKDVVETFELCFC